MKSYIVRRAGGRQAILEKMKTFTIEEFCEIYHFRQQSVPPIERKLNRRFMRRCKACQGRFGFAELSRSLNCFACRQAKKLTNYQKAENTNPKKSDGDRDYQLSKKKFGLASMVWGPPNKNKLRARGQNWLA